MLNPLVYVEVCNRLLDGFGWTGSEGAVVIKVVAVAARANNYANFAAYFDRMLDELFIARNEDIFSRVMSDTNFRSAAHEHLSQEIFRRVREQEQILSAHVVPVDSARLPRRSAAMARWHVTNDPDIPVVVFQ